MNKTKRLTRERLKQLLYYEPHTGIFKWKIWRGGTAMRGSTAGHIRDDGYRIIGIDQVTHRASRIAFLYMTGKRPNIIDHINRIRDDDRWCNLRNTSKNGNGKNRSLHVRNTSGVSGVSFDDVRKNWKSYITIDGRQCFLGRYKNKHDAIIARYCGELKYGWIECSKNTAARKYVDGFF